MAEQKYDITGELHAVEAVQTFPSGFVKREIVIKTADNPQYPQFIKLELHKDRVKAVDGMSVGDTVEAAFDLQGREHNGKYYTSLICWKIKATASGAVPAGDADTPDDSDGPGF